MNPEKRVVTPKKPFEQAKEATKKPSSCSKCGIAAHKSAAGHNADLEHIFAIAVNGKAGEEVQTQYAPIFF